MSDCIFCRIADGEIPSTTIYEDDDVYAFLDANPLVEGHTLVIPKQHAEHLTDLDPETASAYFRHVPTIVDAVERGTDADGATLAWNNGTAAGQEVPHTHLHIVPRHHGDNHGPIHALFGGQRSLPDDEMARIGKRITDQIA